MAARRTAWLSDSDVEPGDVFRVMIVEADTRFVKFNLDGVDFVLKKKQIPRVWPTKQVRELKVGDEIEVCLLGQDDRGLPMFTGRHDEVAGWERSWIAATADLVVGHWLRGSVTNVVNFGAFVDLGGGAEGLLHVSEVPDDMTLAVGDPVDVEIVSIDRDRQRVALRIPGHIHVPEPEYVSASEPAPAEETTSGRSLQAGAPGRRSVRVYEVAKAAGVTNRQVLDTCKRLDIPARSASTKLTATDARRLQEAINGDQG